MPNYCVGVTKSRKACKNLVSEVNGRCYCHKLADPTNPKIPNSKGKDKGDAYTREILEDQYELHKNYALKRKELKKKIEAARQSAIPEDISENIVKFIIHNKLGDTTSRWDCKVGDLFSQKEGKEECKCFTSNGPLSFSPSAKWDVLYFLDARSWLTDNKFILYRVPLSRTSPEWQKVGVSAEETMGIQSEQKRRPRLVWDTLYPQIKEHCTKIYEGSFEEIFIPIEAQETLPIEAQKLLPLEAQKLLPIEVKPIGNQEEAQDKPVDNQAIIPPEVAEQAY